MNKGTFPLNESAKAIAKEFASRVGTTEFLAQTAVKVLTVRHEVEAELKAQGAKLIRIAKDGDKKLEALREESKRGLDEIEKKHHAYIQLLRTEQPELRDVEFTLSDDYESYTVTGPREIVVSDEEVKERRDEAEDTVKSMVDSLLSKYMKP
jgi:hypothetical protein